MSNKKETFGGEIVKQMPVSKIYDDLLHPGFETLGKGLQNAIKLALTPITAAAWGYDQVAKCISIYLPEYFIKRKISKEKITTPDASIAVPIIENLRYTKDKEELREMFINLLGASMTEESIDVHPAFVDIIKQLLPDECKIIKYLHQDNIQPMIKLRIQYGGDIGERDLSPYFSDISYNANCQYPQKFPEYLDNLCRLGIVEVQFDRFLANEAYYDKLKLHPEFPKANPSVDNNYIIEKKSMFRLSEFGKKFCTVCLS